MNRAFDKVTDVQLKACIEGVIYGEYGNMEWYRLAVQLGQPKVQFDTENIDIAPIAGLPPAAALVDFLGVHTLSNGLTFWGMQAGGDWEIPVCFIIYLSDGRFRIYIPKAGNLWNTVSKAAYGNTDNDTWNAYKRFHSQLEVMTPADIADTDVMDLGLEPNQVEILADILLRFGA